MCVSIQEKRQVATCYNDTGDEFVIVACLSGIVSKQEQEQETLPPKRVTQEVYVTHHAWGVTW